MTTIEKILEEIKDINYAYNDCSKYNTIKNLLEEMEERKKGHWVVDEDGNIECSECGHSGVGDYYCERCGADMRGEQDG